jgi:RNA polymerase sigma-70 factor (ECF subfamily)
MASTPTLEQVYDAHAQALFAFLVNLLRNEADARDVLQEVFVKLARQPDCLREARDERSFLLRMAHNLAIDAVRRQETRGRNHEAYSEEVPLFAASPNPDEQTYRQCLAAALGEIPADQRAVIHLKLWEGLTFEAIAEALDISTNTAASRYRYGMDKLRERLRPIYEEIK